MSDFPHAAGLHEADEPVPRCLCGDPAEGRPHLPDCPFGQWLETHDAPSGAIAAGPDFIPNDPIDVSGQVSCHCEEMLLGEAKAFEIQAAEYPADSPAARMFFGHAAYLRSLCEVIVARHRLGTIFRRDAAGRAPGASAGSPGPAQTEQGPDDHH